MKYYPIYTDLNNKPVLVVGAGEVAERKIETLLQASAKIYVVAKRINKAIQSWIINGEVIYLANQFNVKQLDKVFLVIAATDNQQLNKTIYQAATERYKFVNVVDNQALCNFILPAIIDRSPIQIAISTAGASPVLARKLRAQIEIMIPRHIGAMANIARAWRGRVKQKIKTSLERRLFWEKLFNSEFDLAVRQQRIAEAETILQQQLAQKIVIKGEVILVGAGPGDMGLLTLKGFAAIQAADVVLYDSLVSTEILNSVRKDAEKVFVGKRAGKHHLIQAKINQLLIEYAQQGKRVVRLKGGDPFIFGRGAEELTVLKQAGIPYQVIPGVTAALGASAYAGIPLTHRDFSQTVIFITGHLANQQQTLDWQLLARAHQSLVIYMGVLQATQISAALLENGRLPETPVAIISHGTLDKQMVLIGTLSQLPQLAQSAQSPSLMIIGEVVKLQQQLNWFADSFSQSNKAFQVKQTSLLG